MFTFTVDRKDPKNPMVHIEARQGECRREFAARTVSLSDFLGNRKGLWLAVTEGTLSVSGDIVGATIDCKLL